MLWNLRVPLRRKLGLTALLCSGIFVITAAIVGLLMSLLNAESTLNTNRWATREEIAGILAVNAPIIKPMFHWSFWKKDFDPHRARRPRKAVRVAPPNMNPMVMTDVPPARRLGLLSSLESGVTPARRLGVLSSIRSGYFSRLSSRDGSRSKSGVGGSGVTGSSGLKVADCEAGKEMQEVDEIWGMRARDGSVIAYPPSIARDGPQPLLPEPMHSWSSKGDSLSWPGLKAIDEEEK